MKKLLFIISCICFMSNSFAQSVYPEVGKQMPDFSLDNIQNYTSPSISHKSVKGKFIVLDFWDKGCTSCIRSFPKVNKLKQQFGEKVDIILVGYNDKEKEIIPIYEKLKKRLNLDLPIVFDTLIFKLVPHAVPHLIWIDNKGIVQAITASTELDEKNLNLFVQGKKFPFFDRSFNARESRNFNYLDNELLLINNNGLSDTSFLYRSVLTKYNPGLPIKFSRPDKKYIVFKDEKAFLQPMGVSLQWLYLTAFAGKNLFDMDDPQYGLVYPKLVIEAKDSIAFKSDFATNTGIYCYSASLPKSKATPDRFQKMMANDLQNYFDFSVEIETRNMPVYVLKSAPQAHELLKVKNLLSKPKFSTTGEILIVNQTTHELLRAIWSKFQQELFIDETTIKDKIEINIKSVIQNLEQLNEELSKYGLQLTKELRPRRTIVIKDAKL